MTRIHPSYIDPFQGTSITPPPSPQIKIVSKAQEFNPVKAGTKKAHVIFVLDESSSMDSCRDTTISGYNEFLKTQQGTKVKTSFSLYKFNGYNVNRVFSDLKEKYVRPIDYETYKPNGMTNLNDAIGEVMFEVNALLSNEKKSKRPSVTIVILTDGQENTSTAFDSSGIKGMVELAEGKDWGFMFLGADMNTFAVGQAYGFRHDNTMQYDTTNMAQTMGVASASVNRMKTSRNAGQSINVAYVASSFTDAERKTAKEDK